MKVNVPLDPLRGKDIKKIYIIYILLIAYTISYISFDPSLNPRIEIFPDECPNTIVSFQIA
jgi:hypothetical protein